MLARRNLRLFSAPADKPIAIKACRTFRTTNDSRTVNDQKSLI
jgi:hypothetical protein